MSASWNAAGVRGRGLVRRRIGAQGARRLAASGSLSGAVEILAATPYRREIRPGMDLAGAQRAVSATVLWHLRILAGWAPPLSSAPLRLLAAGFELANITGHLETVTGGPPHPPYELGSAATSWSAVSRARTPAEVRATLAVSAWGDPGTEDPALTRLALQLTWARWVADGVPGAADWAVTATALLLARLLAAGATSALGEPARRDADRLVGARWRGARSLADLPALLPPHPASAVDGVRDPADLWSAEARWWRRVESDAAALVARPVAECSSSIGVIGLLAVDARRVRAALAVAANGGDPAGVLDAVA